MKKFIIVALICVMVLGIGSASVFANGAEGNCTGFVDADGDGVCDNRGTGKGFIDADGDGVCDNKGAGKGCGCGKRSNRNK